MPKESFVIPASNLNKVAEEVISHSEDASSKMELVRKDYIVRGIPYRSLLQHFGIGPDVKLTTKSISKDTNDKK